YFLVISIMQMIPGLSTTGKYTTIIPLAIFVSFSMAKEGFDDYRRYVLDKSENRSSTWVLRGVKDETGRKKSKPWDGLKHEKGGKSEEQAGEDNEALESVAENDGAWMRVAWEHVMVG